MKLFLKLLFVPSFFLCLMLFGSFDVLADAKSDYEFQYSKYRQNYIEYTILKKDYLENSTLDNQQKAVLAAKQSLISRDQTKASFAEYLLTLCQEKQTDYAPIKPLLDNLRSAKSYYLSEVNKAQTIVTPANLAAHTSSYLENSIRHDQSFKTGIVACKISEMVRIQIQSNNALNIILPKLTTPFSTPLQSRIDDLQLLGKKTNEVIDSLTTKLMSEDDLQNIDGGNYFSEKSETINKIKTFQLKWIDGLIDIDLNYAHS